MDFVTAVRKMKAKPTDSFVIHLSTNNIERPREYMDELRKAMPAGWRGTFICLGPDEKIDTLSLPAARELNLHLQSLLERENDIGVQVGQIWESLDKRDQKRRIEIVCVTSTQVLTKHLETGKRTAIKPESFQSGKRGAAYKLVRNVC